ncbi:unnamed protein product [Blepharisma stoltei]|uniref:Purple acid phosphatase n=1 Tax=Blepharisma stoltei TaxID=1481888 RepID=A0AAU9IX03_9CILI|nr:unnamed protein product [Blepharisma stoltei]
MMILTFLISCTFLRSYALLQPEQIHLSWTERENEMRVTWVTNINTTTYVAYRPVMCPSAVYSDKWTNVSANTIKFNKGEIIVLFQFIHTAIMTGLKHDCFYEYYIVTAWGKSEPYMFSGRTPDYEPPYDDAKNEIDILVFGDWGTGSNSLYVKNMLDQHIKIRNFLGVIHLGDIAYNLDQEDGQTGDDFLNQMQPVAARFAYMVIPGNHERTSNFTHYKERFRMPVNEANGGNSCFYSFNLGPAHFLMMDTEVYLHDYLRDSQLTETNWIAQDLEKANKERDIRPWIIVTSHHAFYCSVNHALSPECGVQSYLYNALFEEMWNYYGVDLFLEGHVHNYERDTPIYKNETVKSEYDDLHMHKNPNAPIYIVSGNAGNKRGHNDPIPEVLMPWTVFMHEDYGYGLLKVFNKTHLYWEQYSAMTGDTIDYVWIVKDRLRYDKPNY